MSRDRAVALSLEEFDSGGLFATLARRIAIPTESQNPDRRADLARYLTEEIVPAFKAMGFETLVAEHPAAKAPFLIATRIEDPARPTIVGYGHGDVIRGFDNDWQDGLSPWKLEQRGDRWYGRGVVDNKGQHTINMAAQKAVIEARGKLGFNAKWIIEMEEETGSPGIAEIAATHRDLLAGDIFIASDGPRPVASRPALVLGARGAHLIDLVIEAREGGHHSGNWGGLLSNPGIQLAHAIACLVGPKGEIRVPALVPKNGMPANVRAALSDITLEPSPGDPAIDADWGEPGLTPVERVFGWCSFEVLAYETGNPKTPVNAIPPRAFARCQLRHVVDVDPDQIIPAIRAHLDRHGFGMVEVSNGRENHFPATRLDLDHASVDFVRRSLAKSTGKKPVLLPNAGGAIPNHIFCDDLGMKTIWIPHSYPGCSQHAPNEHVPIALFREAMALMAGLYWDLGDASRQDLGLA